MDIYSLVCTIEVPANVRGAVSSISANKGPGLSVIFVKPDDGGDLRMINVQTGDLSADEAGKFITAFRTKRVVIVDGKIVEVEDLMK